MKYEIATKPEKHNGGKFYEHIIILHILQQNYESLIESLFKQFGPRGKQWRISEKTNWFSRESVEVTIRFQSKREAMQFKLTWNGDDICHGSTTDIYIKRMQQKMHLNSVWGKQASNIQMLPIPQHAQLYSITKMAQMKLISQSSITQILGLDDWCFDHIVGAPRTRRQSLIHKASIHNSIEDVLAARLGSNDETSN